MKLGIDYTTRDLLYATPNFQGVGFYYQRERFNPQTQSWEVDIQEQELAICSDILIMTVKNTLGFVDKDTIQKVLDRWNDVFPTEYRYRLLDSEEVSVTNAGKEE